MVHVILRKSPLASNRREYLSERRIHSARISRRGLEASFFISFLISESLKSSASFHFSSSFDSGRMKWISPFWERSLTKRDFGKLVRQKHGCNGKDKRVRAIWIKRLRQVRTPFTAFCQIVFPGLASLSWILWVFLRSWLNIQRWGMKHDIWCLPVNMKEVRLFSIHTFPVSD